MALPGLHETSAGWVLVSRYNPNPAPRGLRRLLGGQPPQVTAQTVYRAEIRRDEVVAHADAAVAAAKTVLTSQTHRSGELGEPGQVTHLVMGQLHETLMGMRDVSLTLEKVAEAIDAAESAGLGPTAAAELQEAADRNLENKAAAPARKLAELAALTQARDAKRLLGELENNPLGPFAPESFDDLEARIHAAVELSPL